MFLKSEYPGKNHFFLYLSGVCIIILTYLGTAPITFRLLVNFAKEKDREKLNQAFTNFDFEKMGIDENLGFLLMIWNFAFILLILCLIIKGIHNRTLIGFVTSAACIRWERMFFGAGLYFLLLTFADVFLYLYRPDSYVFNFDPRDFAVLLPIALIFIPMQAGLEELFFRGYLMQGIVCLPEISGFRFLLLPCFSVYYTVRIPRWSSSELFIMIPYYISVGIFLATITLMDDA